MGKQRVGISKLYLALLGALFFCIGCSGVQKAPTETTEVKTATPSKSFENPGGMWMPKQLASERHASILKSLGLEIEAKTLANPMNAPLAAVVSLGGCSASFVSPDGLIVTNHHCVQGALQYHSTPENNISQNGFLAKTRAEEKSNGPSARVYVVIKSTDVTKGMREGLTEIQDNKKRYETIETRTKQMVAACEKDRPNIRCKVASFFSGAEYYLIERLMLRDIRMVYAPHRSVGFYGGDIDNWMWPRHTGDFSFYRAYVGPDGKPADYAKENVPFKPAHYLKVSQRDLNPGDLVMVAGFPGRTYRHQTAGEISEKIDFGYPARIKALTEAMKILSEVGKKGGDAKIKATTFSFYLSNSLKNTKGMMEGLVKGGLAKDKKETEDKLIAWIEEDEERQSKYGSLFEKMDDLQTKKKATRVRDNDIRWIRLSRLLGVALSIVKMAEERPKKDSEREPGYQARNWKRSVAGLTSLSRRYNRHVDENLLSWALGRATKHDESAEWLQLVYGSKTVNTPLENAAFVNSLYEKTKLANEETRVKLYTTASMEDLQKSEDPFIQIALRLHPFRKSLEEEGKKNAGAMMVIKPIYIAALRDFANGELAPDANGTLRITYGTVRGYTPAPGKDSYYPFTTLTQMIEKHKGEEPFDVPQNVRDAAQKGDFAPYIDPDVKDVPVNFLSDLDTTGGNSGSATINGKGELVGLLFDGNYEAIASDIVFIPALTRSIHVDTRYMLWVMDKVDGAHNLLKEMDIQQ